MQAAVAIVKMYGETRSFIESDKDYSVVKLLPASL